MRAPRTRGVRDASSKDLYDVIVFGCAMDIHTGIDLELFETLGALACNMK